MERRTLLSRMLPCLAAVVASVVGAPALIMGLAPGVTRREGERWRPLGPLSRFPVGEVIEAQFARPGSGWPQAFAAETVYVWRPAAESVAEQVVVFSRNCTDLRCPVVWDAGSACFFCPCHGGIFAQDGTAMAGPPPRPLYRYATRLRDGTLEIDVNSLPRGA